MKNVIRYWSVVIAVLVISCGAYATDQVAVDKPSKETPAKQGISGKGFPEITPSAEAAKVSFEGKDARVRDILEAVVKQTKEKIVLESTVKGTLASLSLKDVAFESALATVCKSGKLDWRKVYISPDSKLLEQPDKFASTVRLMAGLSFPDMVIAGASSNKLAVHFQEKASVQSAEDTSAPKLGLTKVYLVTNDIAVAEVTAEKKKNSKIEEFGKLAKQQMDAFMQMTPEEREQAMISNLNMMDQVDPSYMAAAAQTLMKADPEMFRKLQAKQTEMLFSMSQEQRRSLMKMGMQMQSAISPEMQQMLAEDAKAVMEEMKSQQGGQ